jgi:hypothetical protein
MLDSKTGKLWKIVVSSIGEGEQKQDLMLLEPIFYISPDGKWLQEPN